MIHLRDESAVVAMLGNRCESLRLGNLLMTFAQIVPWNNEGEAATKPSHSNCNTGSISSIMIPDGSPSILCGLSHWESTGDRNIILDRLIIIEQASCHWLPDRF